MEIRTPRRLRIVAAVCWLSIFSTTVARAQSNRCEGVFSSKIASRAEYQSSVEVEIGATDRVVDLFDTADGTLAPVMGSAKIESLPADLQVSLRDYVGTDGDPLTVPWDVLTPAEKTRVLMASAEARGQKFFESRKVQGLVYRPFVTLNFETKTRFLGEDYEPGTYQFASSAIFGSTAIEYMGPNRMTRDLGFELHVRSDYAAGENLASARVVQDHLGGERANVHLHMVAAKPGVRPPTRLERFWSFLMRHLRQRFVSTSDAAVFRSADFVRRSMLYFEVQMIERGLTMTRLKNSDDDATNFYPVDPADFMRFSDSLRAGDAGAPVRSKSGTVGVRTSHFYDQNVFGIEVRYLSPLLNQAVTAEALTALQARMTSGRYFLSPTESTAYLGGLQRRGVAMRQATANLLYASNFERKLERSGLTDAQKALVRAEVAKNDFIKMLFHDWSLDPLYANRPERLDQVRRAQSHALRLLLHGQESAEVMAFFVKKSALSYDLRREILGEAP